MLSGVAWMAASGPQSSKVERGLSDVSRIDVGLHGHVWGPKRGEQCSSPTDKKESSDTERICGDAGFTCLVRTWRWTTTRAWGELGFVPCAVGEPLRGPAKHMCDDKCNEQGVKFYELTAIVTEEGGMPQAINLCRDFYDYRMMEQRESKESNAVWKDLIRQKTSRGRLWAAFA